MKNVQSGFSIFWITMEAAVVRIGILDHEVDGATEFADPVGCFAHAGDAVAIGVFILASGDGDAVGIGEGVRPKFSVFNFADGSVVWVRFAGVGDDEAEVVSLRLAIKRGEGIDVGGAAAESVEEQPLRLGMNFLEHVVDVVKHFARGKVVAGRFALTEPPLKREDAEAGFFGGIVPVIKIFDGPTVVAVDADDDRGWV